MTWFRIDDGFSDHPKVDALGDGPCFEASIALWTLAGSWSAKHLTDGFVPLGRLSRIGVKNAQKAADELVRVGLWEREDDGYRFRNWHEYQPSKQHVEGERAKSAERVRRYREKKDTDPTRTGNAVGNAVTPPVTNGVSNAAPVPTRPDPSRPLATLDRERAPEPGLVKHLHLESRRALGRAWFGLEGVLAAWDGGGLRAHHGDVDRCKAVLAWAADSERTGGLAPRVAITRAVEGYARTPDKLVVSTKRALALFASDPGRWLSATRASSSEPSDFDAAPAATADLPEWMEPAPDVH